MEITCKQCKESFGVTENDQTFYKKLEVPIPTLCPRCRKQRRLAFRNERSLYKRNCDLCSKAILSAYNPKNSFQQYCNNCYFSDTWNAQDYALDFDSQKTFFEQFKKLYDSVPKLSLYVKSCENCDYTNIVLHNKNCYLLFGSGFNQDSLYSTHVFYCENCVDCSFSQKCNECYQLIDCENCYRTRFSVLAEQCQDSWFLYDCRNCKNCIGCWNLRNKEYHIFNKPVIKEQYEQYLKSDLSKIISNSQTIKEFLSKISDNAIRKFQISENSENVTGNFIYNSKNAFDSYNIDGCEDVNHLVVCLQQKDSGDAMGTSFGELAYDCLNNDYAHKTRWCINSTYLANCDYCDSCDNSKNLFGCVGLRHKECCVLNKQYTKEKYSALVSRIIKYMKKTGEFGEFFPISISPFSYNETVAFEYYPLPQAQTLSLGGKWKNEDSKNYQKQTYKIPQNIKEVADDVLNETFACTECGKNYKIIQQELKFYRQHNLTLPKTCPHCRHTTRIKTRNPRKLWNRNCGQCGMSMQTSYSREKSKKIFCEKCYLQAIY